MRLLVTGGLGYIGSEIVAVASTRPGASCITLGRSPVPASMTIPPNVTHETGSVLDEKRVREVLITNRITHIVHSAGARTNGCGSDPLVAINSNVGGTDALFRAARSVDSVERIVFVSTAAVYGKVRKRIDESHPLAPASNYAIAKAAAELVAAGHTRGATFQTAIVRPGYVMGPARLDSPNTAKIDGFIHQALNQGEVRLTFTALFFVHLISELAAGLQAILEAELSQRVDTFHLPGYSSTAMGFADCLQRVAGEFGYSTRIEMFADKSVPLPCDLDPGHFEDVIGPRASSDLETMIRRVIEKETALL